MHNDIEQALDKYLEAESLSEWELGKQPTTKRREYIEGKYETSPIQTEGADLVTVNLMRRNEYGEPSERQEHTARLL